MKKIKLNKILPLFVMFGGAASLFTSNVIAKGIMDAQGFMEWSYLLTLVTIFFSFSAIGSEQLITRCGKLIECDGESKYILGLDVLIIFIISSILFQLLFLFFLNGVIIDWKMNYYSSIVIMSLISFLQFQYQVRRSSGNILIGQAYYNFWRILLFFILVILNGEFLSVEMMLIISLFVSILILSNLKQCSIEVNKNSCDFKETAIALIPFATALFTMTILGSFDRLLVDWYIKSKNVLLINFSDYFYFSSTFLAPFSILASYFGYSETKNFKQSFNKNYLYKRLMLITFVSLTLSVVWALVIHCFGYYINLTSMSLSVFVMMIAIAVIKCVYGICSSAMGVVSSIKDINMANFIFIISLILTLLFLSLVNDLGLVQVLFSFVVLWFIRLCTYTYFLCVRSK